MLTKLLKYEYKTTARILLSIGAGVLTLCLVTGLMDRLLDPVPELPTMLVWMRSILSGATVLALLFVFAACFFINVQRFYRLLGDQGYLMFTLPVPAWQHMVAKLVCACSWTVVMFLYLILCGDLMAGNYADLLPSPHWPSMSPAFAAQLLLLGLLLVLVLAVAYLQFYLCCAIGAQFGQQRLLASIVAYFVMGFVEQVLLVMLVVMIAFGAVQTQGLWDGYLQLLQRSPDVAGALLLVVVDLILLLVAAIHWAVTQWLITRRLNLV